MLTTAAGSCSRGAVDGEIDGKSVSRGGYGNFLQTFAIQSKRPCADGFIRGGALFERDFCAAVADEMGHLPPVEQRAALRFGKRHLRVDKIRKMRQ